MIRLALLLVLLFSTGVAHAKRVALVVAVGAYQAVPRLANPVNDARLVAASLRSAGFTVSEVLDPDRTTLVLKLAAFRQSAVGAEAAVIYFAGHGVEIEGRNLLLPRDVLAGTAEEVKLTAINARDLASGVNPATRMRLVVLDACRDNPFVAALGSTRSLATSRGLARETIGGVVTLLATQAGEKAADTGSAVAGNSPFARAFADAVKQPGLEVVRLPSRVARLMAQRDGIQQQPDAMGIWIEDDFRLVPGAAQPAVTPASVDLQREMWDLCKVATSPAPCRAYLDRHAGGTYAELAKMRLEGFVSQPSSVSIGTTSAAMTPHQIFEAGRRHETGDGVPQNNTEAARHYKLAANKGYAPAQYALGMSYIYAAGVRYNEAEGIRLLKLAANQGLAVAQGQLGYYYSVGLKTTPKNNVEAARLLKRAADQGEAEARYNLARLYEEGVPGVPRNQAEAIRLYKLAANQGSAGALDAVKRLGDTR